MSLNMAMYRIAGNIKLETTPPEVTLKTKCLSNRPEMIFYFTSQCYQLQFCHHFFIFTATQW